eukprot:SAG22_NODE_3493_length_1683_cov_1.063131_2_plen_209_part_00
MCLSNGWPLDAGRHHHGCAPLPGIAPLIDAVLAIDQQGVWESRPSRDRSLATGPGQNTTMQMVITEECDEWHSGSKYKFPQTFVGPPLNTSSGNTNTISCLVLPAGIPSGWAGIGIGGQCTSGTIKTPPPDVLAVWSSGRWAFNNMTGQVAGGSPNTNSWINLTVALSNVSLVWTNRFQRRLEPRPNSLFALFLPIYSRALIALIRFV